VQGLGFLFPLYQLSLAVVAAAVAATAIATQGFLIVVVHMLA
jgi:hypothetical protein